MTKRSTSSVVAFATRREDALAEAARVAAATAYDEQLLTVEQAVVETTLSANTIRRAYTNGHLKVVRFGRYPGSTRGLRIKRGELRRWLEAGGATGEPETRSTR